MKEVTDYHKRVFKGLVCPYCRGKTKLVSQRFIYGRMYNDNKLICCVNYPKCNAYVGTHAYTSKWNTQDTALGRLAKKPLRLLKKKAHKEFDALYKYYGMTRKEAYKWLSEAIGISPKYCHIGFFGVDNCKKVIELVINKKKQIK